MILIFVYSKCVWIVYRRLFAYLLTKTIRAPLARFPLLSLFISRTNIKQKDPLWNLFCLHTFQRRLYLPDDFPPFPCWFSLYAMQMVGSVCLLVCARARFCGHKHFLFLPLFSVEYSSVRWPVGSAYWSKADCWHRITCKNHKRKSKIIVR